MNESTSLAIIISLTLISGVYVLSNTYASASAAPVPNVKERNSDNISRIILKIDGIDYSTLKAQVWINAGNITISKTINPLSLLPPSDDSDGIILVPLEFKKGLIKPGESFTACVKILHDTDKYVNQLACQKGVAGSSSEPTLQPRAAAANGGNNNDTVVRIPL